MRVLAVSALAVLLLAAAQSAPPRAAHLVSGIVVDQAGAVVPGAVVELRVQQRVERTATTDAKGAFRFDNVPEGAYELRVTLAGFVPYALSVTLGPNPMRPLRIILAAASSHEAVAVDAAKGMRSASPAPPLMPGQTAEFRQYPMTMDAIGGRGGAARKAVQEFNTETYDRIDENGYHRATDDPLSTLSIDVDTASYSNVRRFLNEGAIPPPDAVRIEELVNYFRFAYAAPRSSEPFSVTTEVAVCPWNPKHRLALVGLQARRIEPGKTPARNLVFLLDVSGSMDSPDKLPLVKTAMRMLADTLTAEDRVAVVVYAGASGLALRSTPGDRKLEIQQAIAELTPGGSTNGAAGIRLAYDTAAAHFVKDGINRVILATDGDFNVGVTNQGELTRLIEEQRDRGIFLSVLGVGTGNLKDSTMEKLADRGNGNYAYLDSLHEARRVLVAEAGATLVTVAKDVKIQVEFNPRKVGAYRLIGYENRLLAKEDFNNDKKDAGAIGAGHSVTALYEIVPPGEDGGIPPVDKLKYQQNPAAASDRMSGGSSSNEMMTVKLRYKAPDGETSKLMEVPVNDRSGEPTANLGFAAAVAEFGFLLRKSDHKGQSTWASALELARRHRGDDPDGYRAEFIRLVDLASALDSQRRTDSARNE
jgi:Ca-activated chloride channel family protein